MKYLKAAVAAFFILILSVPAYTATELRLLGGPGALNDGDLWFGNTYFDSPGGRRVYGINLSVIPFSTDNTIFGEALYPLAAGSTWKTFYTDGSGVLTPLSLGTSGYVLTSNGASSAPSWELPSGGGSIESTSSILKGNGSGDAVAATEGTDFVAPSGNVATATALAANPSDCTGGQFAVGINADGTAVCDTPSGSGDMLASVYDANSDNVVDSAEALSAQYIDWDQSSGPTSIANKPSLGSMALQASSSVSISGGTIAGVTITGATMSAKQDADSDLTALANPATTNVVFYKDNSGDLQSVALGAANTVLTSQGATSAPQFSAAAAGNPSGSDTQVQFNDGGSFGGDAGMVYDKDLDNLTVDNTVTAGTFTTPQSASVADFIQLRELSGNGTNYIGLTVPDAITTSYTLKYPDAEPSAQVLQCAAPSGGVSACSWVSAGGSPTFADVGAGTNTNALVVGTSGSLTTSGTGTITATHIGSSTGPTIDSAGDIAIDTTADQLKYYGSAAKTLDPRLTENATFKDPTSGDKAKFRKPYGMTVSSVGCVSDAATSVVLDVQECNSSGASCTTILSGTLTCGTTYEYTDGTPSITDSSIAAANYVFFSLGTVTGTPGYLYVDFNYTVTGE